MSKNSSSFLHYSNARNDQKIIQLRAEFGLAGYGAYFAILEMLREADNCEIAFNVGLIAYSLNVTKQELEPMINLMIEVDLLQIEDNNLFSIGLKDRVEALQKKSENLANNRKGKVKTKEVRKKNKITTIEIQNNNNELSEDNQLNNKCLSIDNEKINGSLIKENKNKLNKTKLNLNKLSLKELPEVWNYPEAIEALESWVNYRTEIKKPIGKSTLGSIIKCYPPEKFIRCVANTMANGWVGLREPVETPPPATRNNFTTFAKPTNFERNMSILSESLEKLHGKDELLKKIN